MKRLLLAGAALAALSSASFAADMPIYPAEAAVAPVESDWAGFYLGIQGGYNWADGDSDVTVPLPTLFAVTDGTGFDTDGFSIGLYSGYNRQFGNWVFGIDNSISYVDIEEDDFQINTFSATRGRIGYSFGNFLVFAAGGLSLAHGEVDFGAFGGDEDDHLFVGWTAGGGVEAKLGGNWSARVEYLYADYGEERFASDNGVVVDVDFDMSVVRGGIAYHF
ncbi:outer membrane protein [Terrihabitans sp. B22-R8]|uniref:outer membrane protein n=1 Tax=Terrihabitans sp. B22-R8 TaxID=3425128 RepID=UPI00403CD7D8